MAAKTPKTSAKDAKKATIKRVVAKASTRKTALKPAAFRSGAKPALLAGGNPQVAMADGDAPVQAYIAAMPSWKRDVGRRLDALIVRTATSIASRITSRWRSSAVHPCVLSPQASRSRKMCVTSTSTRATSSTRSASRVGFGRRRSCQAGCRKPAGGSSQAVRHNTELRPRLCQALAHRPCPTCSLVGVLCP